MSTRYILSDYVDQAMALAVYDKLEDGTFVARIPPCEGVIACPDASQVRGRN